MKKIPKVTILKLDTDATQPSGKGALLDMVLVLSQTLPYDAERMFDHAWRNNMAMYKRSASLNGNRITVTCMEDELQGQVDMLKDVLSEVVRAYNERVEEEERRQEEADKNAADQKKRLLDLNDRLKF